MAAEGTPVDLLDLKMMPAWVSETPRPGHYADFEGEETQTESRGSDRRGPRPRREKRPGPRGPKGREGRERDRRPPKGARERGGDDRPRRDDRPAREARPPLPQIGVRFLPHRGALESVIAQIKSESLAYSVFALARMFLDKAERYEVQLTAPAESPLHQLGEHGPVAADRRILEGSAFASLKDEFYAVEVTQSEPLKGNFTNVARDRASGTLLGPTNHHNYQPALRNLYEQRYSRRMSFQDFQRQIEIVSDPAVVEEWKDQARSVATYTTKKQESPETFSSTGEAERHFRQTHLPELLRAANELTISGVASRQMPDRALGRAVENAWVTEIRSPSRMMQELAGALRGAGLNIFRHRRGMLFVSPIRVRAFAHDRTSVSPSINSILERLTETQPMSRKQLAEKLVEGITEPAEIDRVKLSLASDLRWLISEGYVIEFNDGSLDLPRAKVPPPQPAEAKPEETAVTPAEQAIASDEVQQNAGATEAAQVTPANEEAVGIAVVETIQPEGEPSAPRTMPNQSAEPQS